MEVEIKEGDSRIYECGVVFEKRFEWWDVWVYLYKQHNMTATQIVDLLKLGENLEQIVKIAYDIKNAKQRVSEAKHKNYRGYP